MAGKTIMSSKVMSAVHEYVSVLREQNITYSRIIVFGSHAKGTALDKSDIDLCVVSEDFGKDYHNETVRLIGATDYINVPMDVVAYNSIDLADKYDPLASEIRRVGIQVA